MALTQSDSVPSVTETAACGEIAEIYADIRATLGTSVVNLIWRNLATMPDALRWTWSTVRPLYVDAAAPHAEAVRHTLSLPDLPQLSVDTLTAAGIDRTALTAIRSTLDSYYHTNRAPAPLLERRTRWPPPIQPNFRRCRRWRHWPLTCNG